MKLKISFLIGLIGTLFSFSASAHPGHGVTDNGVMHYFSSPEHAIPALILVASVLGVLWVMYRKKSVKE